MFIHIFTKENVYSNGLLNLIGKHLDPSEHLFIFSKSESAFSYPETIRRRIIYAGNLKKLILTFSSLFKECKQIFFHYLPSGPSLAIWFLSPVLLRKSTWVLWGGDIYPLTTYRNNLSSRIYELLRKNIIKKVRRIAAFVQEDYDIVRKIYSADAPYSQILYPIPLNPEMLQGIQDNSEKPEATVILLGNSASRTNNHSGALDMLSSLKESKIKIICPLSYGGDKEYIEHIIRKGNDIFGNKFVPITSFIEPARYSRLLTGIDVAVMNHRRQQGLGNTLPVLFLGKKVYLRDDTSSYSFLKRHGCSIYSIEELEKNPQNLFHIEEDALRKNQEIVRNIISEENCLRLWNNLFHLF